LICFPLTYGYFLTQLLPHYLAQTLGYWVTCRVKMMSLRHGHGWGWHPPQTICCIHMKYIQCVSAISYADHRHTFWTTGSLVESKWCHYVMVEADSHLKLFIAYIWNIYKVFEHIDMLSIDVRSKPYTVITTQLGTDFGVLGRLWSQNDVITSRLRPTANSNYLLHLYETYTKCLAHWYTVHWCMVKALHSYNHTTWLRFWCTGSLVESKWYHYVMVEADSQLKLFIAYICNIYKVFQHIDMLSIDIR
jgi:hypothetical protein